MNSQEGINIRRYPHSRGTATTDHTKHVIYYTECYKIWQGSWTLEMLKTGFSNIQGKIAALENPIIYEKHITYDWN